MYSPEDEQPVSRKPKYNRLPVGYRFYYKDEASVSQLFVTISYFEYEHFSEMWIIRYVDGVSGISYEFKSFLPLTETMQALYLYLSTGAYTDGILVYAL